jgi:cytochrome c oxidase assembly protein subunit 11
MQHDNNHKDNLDYKKKKTLFYSVLILTFMVGLTFSAVPLYDWFCRTTGFGGTPIVKDEYVEATNIPFKVRFDANMNEDLDLEFNPLVNKQDLKIGEDALAFYKVTNNSNSDIATTSIFNVYPYGMGAYFIKVECFCFTKQVVPAGETVEMPVSYYIDPEILEDPQYKDHRNITLSYTMYEYSEEKNRN